MSEVAVLYYEDDQVIDTTVVLEMNSGTDPLDEVAAPREALGKYLSEIRQFPVLGAEEEVDLAKRIEAGLLAQQKCDASASRPTKYTHDLEEISQQGRDAKEYLWISNLSLVVSIAKRHQYHGLELLDLIQAGNISLKHAIEKFDYTKGFKFSTYATDWIVKDIRKAIPEEGRTIRLPRARYDDVLRVYKTERSTRRLLGRAATNAVVSTVVAKELNLSPDKLKDIKRFGRDPLSLETLVGGDDRVELGNLLRDANAVIPGDSVILNDLQQVLGEALGNLSDDEATVIKLRFGLDDGRPKTLAEVGKVIGQQREHVRQMQIKALAKLRPLCELEGARGLLLK